MNNHIKCVYLTLALAASAMPAITPAYGQSMTMERISIVYRSPLDYALYQHTTQLLAEFNLELQNDIVLQAKRHNQAMASKFMSQVINANTTFAHVDADYTQLQVANNDLQSD